MSLQKIYLDRFGVELPKEEAYEKGLKIMRLVKLIYQPMTIGEFEMVQKRKNELK